MEINELLENYVAIAAEESKNLINIAFDEMESSQYEEAAAHCDQLYVKDSNDYMSYFFRAYCKSHCGIRGNAYADSQTLTSAFELASKKALAKKENLGVNLYLILKMYTDAMENLRDNAVDNTSSVNITDTMRYTIFNFANQNMEIIKDYKDIKDLLATFLKSHILFDLEKFGPTIISLDPSYKPEYEMELKKLKTKKTLALAKFIIPIAIIVIIVIVSTVVSFAK